MFSSDMITFLLVMRGEKIKLTPERSGVRYENVFHGSTLLTDTNPSLCVLCNGRARPGLLPSQVSAGSSKAVTVPFLLRTACSRGSSSLSGFTDGVLFHAFYISNGMISLRFCFVKQTFSGTLLPFGLMDSNSGDFTKH